MWQADMNKHFIIVSFCIVYVYDMQVYFSIILYFVNMVIVTFYTIWEILIDSTPSKIRKPALCL